MKTLKTLLVITLSCLSVGLYAQNWDYPDLDGSYNSNSYNQSYCMFINQQGTPTGTENRGFKLYDGTIYNPIFQVDTNGTMTFGSRKGNYPAYFTLMQGAVGYAQLNTSAQNLNIVAKRQVRIKVRGYSECAVFDDSNIDFHTNVRLQKNDVELRFGLDNNNAYGWIGSISNSGCILGAGAHNNIYLDPSNYCTFIGNISPTEANAVRSDLKSKYRLFVKGGVLSEDYAIAPQSSWADFVFKPNYGLKPINELKQFIQENKHLPDVPSEKMVKENGYSQHEMNKILLQKIEELTLYIIQQDEKIKQQNARIEELESVK